MTKDEIQTRINELKGEINKLKGEVNELEKLAKEEDIKGDEVFLLSVAEYEKYQNAIPHLNQWWWLRSPGKGFYAPQASFVSEDGSVYVNGAHVDDEDGSVRPALRISNSESSNLKIGDRLIKYNFPWIKIADNLVIAEVSIGTHRFNKEISWSNDYETSEIRQWLKDWKEKRI